MPDYIVPPKTVVSHNGQSYGAGDRVPGYKPDTPTPAKTKEADKAPKEKE